MAIPKLQVTKDYRIFSRSIDNRRLVPEKHKRLKKSMEKYGFLPCFPIAVYRDASKKLIIFDGQHRLALAETLGLAVYFVEIAIPFDIAEVNCTQEKWATRNFAETYASQGNEDYVAGLEFADRFKISVGCAFGMLAGTVSWNNIRDEYYSGEFKITDARFAETVGTIYSHIVHIAPCVKNARLLESCMAIGRAKAFDPQRLIQGVDRCREKLVAYSTRDAYLVMLEEIYNFGRKNLVSLKNEAIMAMRDRNVVKKKLAGAA